MQNKKILIADDEERILTLLADFFNMADFDVLSARDGAEALTIFRDHKDTLSLAILDIMMPEVDGWQVCREIRKESNLPIIMLSARSEDFDLLTGFEAGADEYVTKPFSPAVLIKRAEALIRRSEGFEIDKIADKKGLYIDNDSFMAFVDGKPLTLTLKEFEVLSYLYDNKGRVLTRDQLLNAVWGYDYLGDTRTVDSHIARIRTKLGDFGVSHLKTIYGMGYKFEV